MQAEKKLQKRRCCYQYQYGCVYFFFRYPAGWLKLQRPVKLLSPEISLYGEVSTCHLLHRSISCNGIPFRLQEICAAH